MKFVNKFKNVALSIIIMLSIFVIVPATNVNALANPTTLSISAIHAYESVLADTDQLYIVVFDIDYDTGNITGLASTNFLFRFFDNGIEIAAVTPYAFYNGGYSEGVASFYFSATDTNKPTWGVNDITITLQGNPAFTWDTSPPPSTSNNGVSWSTALLLPARIRLLAQQLENVYIIDMIELISGSLKLTEYGDLYFETVIPNLRIMVPSIFSDYVVQPTYTTTENYTSSLDATSREKFTGTVFDQTATATLLGIDASWIYSIIWLMISGFIVFLYATKIGTIGLTWVIAICLIIGSFSGFLPTSIGIACGVLGGIFIVYPLFFRSASV